MILLNQKKRAASGFNDMLCFVVPATMPFQIEIVGQLLISEIMVLCLLPVLIAQRRQLTLDRVPRRVLILGGLWLLNQIVTDLIRGTSFHDYSRGWSAIAFTILDFLCVFLLAQYKVRRVCIQLLGFAVGYGLLSILTPGIANVRWKMGGGDAVMIGVLALVALWTNKDRTARYAGVLLSSVGAVLGLLFNARNNFGRGVVNIGLLMVQRVLGGKRFSEAGVRRALVLLFVLSIPFTYAVLAVYSVAAQSGIMGEHALVTYRTQENQEFGEFGVLLGGRPEVLISSQAIADSPIIGHGSWARSLYYYLKYRDLAALGFDIEQEGVRDPETLLETRGPNPEIPSHSTLFQSWVWAGIMGGVFWIYVLYLTLATLVEVLHIKNSIVPVVVHASTLLIWDILFSPYGSHQRMKIAVFMTMLIVVRELAKKQRVAPAERRLRLFSKPAFPLVKSQLRG